MDYQYPRDQPQPESKKKQLQDHISFGHESKDKLAVLHNQNDMVRGFGMSAWVSQSQKKVIFLVV